MMVESERFMCRVCGRSFADARPLRLFGTEEPVPERCRRCLNAPSPSQRRRLARAIRGPLHRFDVSGSKLYADLRAGGVEHEAALLLVEAFARKERSVSRA